MGHSNRFCIIPLPIVSPEKKMSTVRNAKTIILCVAVATAIGCNAKQDKPATNAGATAQKAGDVKSISGQNTTGAVVASPQVQTDARAAAAQVLALLEAGDFTTVYKEAEADFKKIGSESQFVAKFQQARQKTGVLKNPKELSLTSVPGKGHVLVYRLENDLFNTDMRLTFVSSKSGKMELAGLNQHDEAKK
jgi:hypothetical protein